MFRFRSSALPLVAAIAAAVAVAACADSSSAPTATPQFTVSSNASVVSSIKGDGRRSRFKFHGVRADTTPSNAAAKKSTTPTPTPVNSGMVFHGGPVLQSATNVVSIYWSGTPIFVNGPKTGTGLGTADLSIVGHFLRNLGGSAWFNINSTYTSATGAKIANVVKYTGYWANATNAPAAGATVADADILTMLQSGFNGGMLKYDSNAVYAVFTGPKVNLGGGAGSVYCAYHSAAKLTVGGVSRVVYYTAQPYGASWPSTCAGTTVSANGDLGADVQVNMLAHEIVETTTDPLGTGWYDAGGIENADKCAWKFGTTSASSLSKQMKYTLTLGGKYFLVQTNWVNAGSGGCVIKY